MHPRRRLIASCSPHWLKAGTLAGLLLCSPAVLGEEQVKTDELEEPAFLFDQVTVTATRSETDVASAPASVAVITNEELQKAPVGDLTDAIRSTPGVTINAGTQGRRTISIRGMDSSYTLVLIDGKRVNSSEAVFRHNDFDIGMVPVEAIERIEVVRGSMSSLYGSDALGGVINIITKPVADKWTGGLDLKGQMPTDGEGGQEYRASLYASGPLIKDKLALRITGAFDQREIWNGALNPETPVLNAKNEPVIRDNGQPLTEGDIATLEGRSDHNGRARLVWTPDSRQTVAAEYGLSRQTREGEYFIGNAYGNADSLVLRNDVVLSHDGKWGWGSSQARVYWEGLDTSDDAIVQNNFVAEGNAKLSLGRHMLTFGAEGRWTFLEDAATFTESGEASVHQEALYAQDEIEIFDSLMLLVGARLDHHKNYGFYPTPRGYLVYNPLEHLTLKGGVGTGFKSPTLRQMSEESITNSCRGACVVIGNKILEPETSLSYELSASWDTRFWGVSAGAFRNDVDNLIDTPRGTGVEPYGTHTDGRPIFIPRNVKNALVQGLEASGRWAWRNKVKLSANYTFVDARDLDADEGLDNRPKHNLNVQADWRILEKLSVFGRGQYLGEQKSGEETIPGYSLFDAGLRYAPHERIGLTGGVMNLANTRVGKGDGYVYQERGRTVYLGVNAQL